MSAGGAVVTGLGVIGPWGAGCPGLIEALRAGAPLSSEVDRTAGYHAAGGARRAALVPSLDLARFVPPAQARRLALPSRWSLAAARMALEDAGLPALEGRRVSVVLATVFGSVLFTEKLVRQILDEGPEAAQPFYFSECVANAPTAQVALALGARGANVTVTQREAGALSALAIAAQEVTEGRADVAITGATDEMTPLLHSLLDRYRAIAKPAGGRSEAPRPLAAGRDGFLAGEGAVALVVERDVDAAARSARPLARIAGSARAFDPTATESDWGVGHERLGRALSALLATTFPDGARIDAIVSGASGAIRGDALEGRVLRHAWPAGDLPPVVAPKGVVGEYGGGHLAAAILAAAGAEFGALAAFDAPDPEIGIVPGRLAGGSPPARILASALASGGAAAWILLERP
jgi:3-oxoacyl-[acyl-carrier-protein] synthase II